MKTKCSDKTILIESRYPKLIYAYTKFFKVLKKIISSEQEIFDELTRIDIYAIKGRHNLSQFENILREYLYESILINDERRIAEAILELNRFIIDYKLRDSKNEENVKENFQFVIDNFVILDDIFKNLRGTYKADYLKNFLEVMKKNKNDKYELTEIPFSVLVQRSNYLKGKLALFSGHYSKALEFFFKSKEVGIICDAGYIRKSISQIKKIYFHFFHTIDNFLKAQSFSMKCSTVSQTNSATIKNNSEMDRMDQTKDKLCEIIEGLNKEINNFSFTPKDLLVLIDFSDTMIQYNSKKIIQACRGTSIIFDNYITSEDRFGLYIFTKFINPIVSLTKKNLNTINYIKENIITLEKLTPETIENSCLVNALERVYNYLGKKSKMNLNKGCYKREKWIIVFTDKNDETSVNLSPCIKEGRFKQDGFNIIIVSMNTEKKPIDLLISLVNFNKSEIIEYEEIDKIRNKLGIKGRIKDEGFNFFNEKYESQKKLYN